MGESVAPHNGPTLIHYAVHYGGGAVAPPSDFFFQIPETEALFGSLRLPPSVERSWRRDPHGMLSSFREALERREADDPSAVSRAATRRLSRRETAIFVARFLTYPDGSEFLSDDGRSAPVRSRQKDALSLPDRDPPSFRRFDLDRGRADEGHYWGQFEAELREHLLRADGPSKQELLSRVPESTKRLLDHSERYAADLEKQLLGRLSGAVTSADLYVERAVEGRLLEALHAADDTLLVLRGEAGFGKSSVLWRLHRRLAEEGFTPVLVSALWIAVGGADRILGVTELAEHASNLSGVGLEPVILLDTADLLLHTEGLIYQTAELLQNLGQLGVRVLLTVRPIEAAEIRQPARTYDLREYEGDELTRAVSVLMAQYFPKLSPEAGVELVERARTRGLPILTVLRSPLLLRMLFDTSGGEFPGLDYDATALYERFWVTRIARDDRGIRVTSDRDLSPVAGRLGILMLADATPVLTEERIRSSLATVTYPVPPDGVVMGIEELARRGVIVGGENTWRFAHQALFEFIAARALLTRGGASATILLEHVTTHPHDLFTGAVLEQLVILLARDQSTRARAREIVALLLAHDHPSVRQIGVIGWCHVPELAVDGVVMDGQTAERVLGHLPQIQSIDAEQALTLIERIWKEHADVAHRALVDCLGLLIHRWPRPVGAFVIEQNLIGTLLASYLVSYNQSESLVALTANLAHVDPVAARELLLTLVERLPDVAGPLRALRSIAAAWDTLGGSDEYAQAVIGAAARAEHQFRAHRRDFGIAAGDVLYASLASVIDAQPEPARREAWDSLAAEGLARVTTTAPAVADAAVLHAIARHLIRLPTSARDHADRILGHLFERRPDGGPFHVVGPFLIALATSHSLARELLVDRLFTALSEGLPASANHAGTPEQWWALTARAALIDSGVPESFVAEVVDGLLIDQPGLWRDVDLLLSAVFPAALGGDARAASLLSEVVRDPTTLTEDARRGSATGVGSPATIEFIERGLQYRDRGLLVTESVLLVAIATRRPGPVATLAGTPSGAEAIRRHENRVRGLIKTMLHGADIDQRDACTCWKRLQENSLVTTTVKELTAALNEVRDPQGRSSLIEMLPWAVAARIEDAPAALALLRHEVLDDLRDANVPKLSDVRKRLADAAFAAYRAILATTASPEGWEPLWELVLRPALAGTGTIDTDRFRDIVTYLQNLLRDHPELHPTAAEHLITAATWAQQNLSGKQAKTISNFLASTARLVLRQGGEPAQRLVEAVGQLPTRLGTTILSTAVSMGGRGHVESMLASGRLDGALAAEAVARLRGHREAGFQPLPQILAPATAQGSPYSAGS